MGYHIYYLPTTSGKALLWAVPTAVLLVAGWFSKDVEWEIIGSLRVGHLGSILLDAGLYSFLLATTIGIACILGVYRGSRKHRMAIILLAAVIWAMVTAVMGAPTRDTVVAISSNVVWMILIVSLTYNTILPTVSSRRDYCL